MHGREGENRKRSRHMWSVPSRGTTTVAGDSCTSTADSFCKDGRRIRIGDCALFKPPQDSPPFIGIIRWLTVGRENNLKLGVNWIYRPTEVKLGKGFLLEAAPNEVFYSFHKDEIPAASLLHPCKVTFLPKGVELPSGLSSFVCRRVYDIANKCLWWLTDQDYIDERQEEVDQLLHKTQIEMHATVQPGGRSPKPMNGPASTSQLKSGSDNVQHNGTSFPTQARGKKRERGDQGSEPVKRERSSKIDDADLGNFRAESILKSEIVKITDKGGGLVDMEGVEKLVQLMLPERSDRKIDLAGRSLLAGAIAATENFDCLSWFVQLKGLPVLDEWLQEVHKGKIGDGSSSRENDKSIEEFLLVLLRALDKLPVNLNALQMCNIGKSVNHLRTHKNMEIHKKARSLVDTWKKRVEAEMNSHDAKSGSSQAVAWPARPRHADVSHGGSRHLGGSSEGAMKSSVTQLSASRSASVKPVQGDAVKSGSASLGNMKSVPSPASVGTNSKDGQPRILVGSVSDPQTAARDEKSSSSSQSHNNSQSCSSDHAKTVAFPGKEDARSSTAGSMSVSKMSAGASRHRKSVNGFPGPNLSGVQRETGSSRSSLHRNPTPEKLSHSGLTCEKASDIPVAEGNNHKLIVKIPNRGRSPAQSASGGSFDDPSIVNSRASSPVISEKHEQFDRALKDKSDAYRTNIASDVNTESWQSNDFKDVLTGSDEGDGSPPSVPDGEHCKTGDAARKMAELSKAASSSSGNEAKSEKLHDGSFTSINALIESCVKCSETNASMSVGDDVGMNLLASVAAGEMSRGDLVSPTDSPQGTSTMVDDCCPATDVKPKPSGRDDPAQAQNLPNDVANSDSGKQCITAGNLWPKDGLHQLVKHASANFSRDRKETSFSEEKPGDHNEFMNSSCMDLQQTVGPCLETNGKSDDVIAASLAASPTCAREKGVDEEDQHHERKSVPTGANANGISDSKQKLSSSLSAEDKLNNLFSSVEGEKKAVEVLPSCPLLETSSNKKNNVNGGFGGGVKTESKPPATMMHSECLEKTNDEIPLPSDSGKDLTPENTDVIKGERLDEINARNHVSQVEKQKIEQENNTSPAVENRVVAGSDRATADSRGEFVEESIENNVGFEPSSGGPVSQTEQHMRSRANKLTGTEGDETDECASTTADASSFSASGGSDADTKLEFDLNEGFNVDDGKCGEPINLVPPGCSASVNLISPLPFPVSSTTGGTPASITVAAAAKGPFVPPDDLLRSKGELGWKGSAATSAFRPAEPRKVLEMSLGTASASFADATGGKQGRPLLDIDLNVPDERILDDMACQNSAEETGSISNAINSHDLARGCAPVRAFGGLDLDLNRVDEAADIGQCSTSNGHRLEVPLLSVKSSLSAGYPNGEVNFRRDFDLNNGPGLEEPSVEPSPFSQPARSSIPSQPSQTHAACVRMNNTEVGNLASWFPQGNTYSALTIPSILPDRGEQSFPIVATGGPPRIMGPHTSGSPFSPDAYRGSVLSSSPAVSFPSSPYQYPVFPFGSSFPLPSATFSVGSTTFLDSSSGGRLCFPAVHTQLIGPGSTVSSQFPRPYVVSLPEGGNNGVADSRRKPGRQSLDLNAGPGGPDIDGRDETLPLTARQLSVASSQALAEEQARMYQVAGGVLKRKDPEGGWDPERFGRKQSSWQ
ncbi:uncharacterized protein LOC131145574 [Malania oleifera]|uniref:uncharacterized protein LOC131145574 n=1 Tax=Malania oleifera TaxID=397392 RepID=UPI0025ADC5FF|nr:uncharacterized protein LOC131145574 [Malania oleifera]XP_057950716.1 uncharacterized protein LOC131145574 [Malania oleifera]XP_057950718.1 uncharacterized protein LOC131145574 [Malania oleifera]XP_057950719.1 uncharacterized protein LOC131145574 [Malania oleifera]